jgi:hypothetical protein
MCAGRKEQLLRRLTRHPGPERMQPRGRLIQYVPYFDQEW